MFVYRSRGFLDDEVEMGGHTYCFCVFQDRFVKVALFEFMVAQFFEVHCVLSVLAVQSHTIVHRLS
jgi:hypothetical protein